MPKHNHVVFIRKIAALDIVFHVPAIILFERAIGPCLLTAVEIACSTYFLQEVSQVQHGNARQVMAFELDYPEIFERMYNRWRVVSIAILFALFLRALVQELPLQLRDGLGARMAELGIFRGEVQCLS